MSGLSGFAAQRPLTGYLGPGVLWTGDLVFEGRFRVDGTFRGRIFSEDLLEIGPTGIVEGQVDVSEAVVAGLLKGELRVRKRLLLESGGRVEGELIVAQVEQRRGASLKAKVTRTWER